MANAVSQTLLTVGATGGLIDIVLNPNLHRLMNEFSEVSFRIENHSQEVLIRKMMEHTLDLALVYDPPKSTDLDTLEITPLELVLVTSQQGQPMAETLTTNYVYVDWGMSFQIEHTNAFKDLPKPKLHTGIMHLALDAVLNHNAAAYLPLQVIQPYLGKTAFKQEEAPVIRRSVYGVFGRELDKKEIAQEVLRTLSLDNSLKTS